MRSSDGVRVIMPGRRLPVGEYCGQEVLRQLSMSGCTSEKDCERSYSLYVPTSICHQEENQHDVLPLVFALHCFGCDPQQMKHWMQVAEQFSFVLVIPKGIQRSWNAGYCCGYALEQGVDDVGFLRQTIDEVSNEFSFVSKDIAYAMGWSNGGYFATHAAELFRAVAPISGHDYQPSVSRPTALFMHHSLDDPYVRFTGCCTDSTMPRCCCEISNHADQCTSATHAFENWATEINKCSGGVRLSLEDKVNGITCKTGIGCVANTTFCTHDHGRHFNSPSFEKAFPMTDQIADFFASNACSINQGTWSSDLKACSCPSDGRYLGRFCLSPGDERSKSLPTPGRRHDGVAMSSAVIAVTGLTLLGVIVALIKTKDKQNRWTQLPTSETTRDE